MDKIEEARRAGMAYAYTIARDKGVDALKKELDYRNITKCPIGINRAHFDKMLQEIKENTVATYTILLAVTLRDEFGMGHDRILRAIKRFTNKADCIAEGYVTQDECIKSIAEEIGIDLGK